MGLYIRRLLPDKRFPLLFPFREKREITEVEVNELKLKNKEMISG